MIRRVRNMTGLLCGLFVLVTALCGCSMLTGADQNVGGWNTGKDISSDAPDEQPKQTEQKEDEAEAPTEAEKLELNTDEFGSGLSVELHEIIGANMILKVTNSSNVCYDRVGCDIEFFDTTGYYYVEKGQLNSHYYVSLGEVPAYGEVYAVVGMPSYTVKATSSKEDSDDDVRHYYFLDSTTFVNVVIDQYELASEEMQDARDSVIAELSDLPYDGDVALFGNKTTTAICCEAYVVFDEKEVCLLDNLSDIVGKGFRVKDTRDNPGWVYCEDTEDCRSVGYAWTLYNPLAYDGLTEGEIRERNEELVKPDLDSYSTIRIEISRAYYDFDMFD